LAGTGDPGRDCCRTVVCLTGVRRFPVLRWIVSGENSCDHRGSVLLPLPWGSKAHAQTLGIAGHVQPALEPATRVEQQIVRTSSPKVTHKPPALRSPPAPAPARWRRRSPSGILQMKAEGASLREIANAMGIGYGTVRKRLRQVS
jgi:hypothetical protein